MKKTPFSYRIPLLNNTLTEENAQTAINCITKTQQNAGATDRLHKVIGQTWDTSFAASFMGGRASLYAIVQALGLQPGDQVLVPAFTCQCVTNAFSFNGVEIVFVDIELDTFGMAAHALKKAITPRSKALLIQYTFGLVCRDIDTLLETARDNQLWIIEDCAHATGGTYRSQALGTLGDIAFFSSERSKIVNTIQGGWVMTNHPQLGESLMNVYTQTPVPPIEYINNLLYTVYRCWKDAPQSKRATTAAWLEQAENLTGYQPVPQMMTAELSGLFTAQYRWRMPDSVSQLLLQQLQQLPAIIRKRSEGAAYWSLWADEHNIRRAYNIGNANSTWLRFPILVDTDHKRNPKTLADELNCDIGVWFTTPMHPQPLELPHCPNGMYAAQHCVNLPTWLPDPV